MGQAARPRSFGGLRVLVAGGGVAGLEAMLALRELAGDLVDVELVSPEHHFWYRPLAVAEPFGRAHVHRFELPELATAVGATFTPGALRAVDPERRVAHTNSGARLAYDVLVVACGTRAVSVLDGALTFRGPSDVEHFRALLAEVDAGAVSSLAFVQPSPACWPLPLYELALLTAAHLEETNVAGVELSLVTSERAPLERLGAEASEAIGALLAENGIGLVPGATPGRVEADRVVALARFEGHRVPGIPHDPHGFVAVDPHGLVAGFEDVYAAGDITAFPVKQGGIATQQADAVAEAVAARAGADIDPAPFAPVLNGLLISGGGPLYLRAELRDGGECEVSTEPLWWPPAKIAGHYLSPFLASRVTDGLAG
jgi:sulfide:quinone oxidoreductase